MFCKYCGKELPGDAHFCPHCGKALDNKAAETGSACEVTARGKGSGKVRKGLLVRSILSLFGLIVPGVFAIIFTLRAAKAETEEEEKRCLRKVKTMNILAYSLFILAMLTFSGILLGHAIKELQDILDDAGFTWYVTSATGGIV